MTPESVAGMSVCLAAGSLLGIPVRPQDSGVPRNVAPSVGGAPRCPLLRPGELPCLRLDRCLLLEAFCIKADTAVKDQNVTILCIVLVQLLVSSREIARTASRHNFQLRPAERMCDDSTPRPCDQGFSYKGFLSTCWCGSVMVQTQARS